MFGSDLICIGVIDKKSSNKQVLDHLPVERERGITVKAQTATMFYSFQGKEYILNLIDTPVRPHNTYLACETSLDTPVTDLINTLQCETT